MQTIAEKQATLERTVREKTAVEKELDRLYAEGVASNASEQTVSTVPVVDQLSSRLETADRERDEALTKRDSVLNQIARNDLLYVSVVDYSQYIAHMAPGLNFRPVAGPRS